MPHFVYDVEGWAWHAKATALVKEFGGKSAAISEEQAAAMGGEDLTHKTRVQEMVFFSPQQFERVRKEWEYANFDCFVGASFPSELPSLARLAPRVAGLFVNNRRMHDTLAACGVRSQLIPNGVDCEFWHPASRIGSWPLRVGWVGNSRHHTHGGRRPHKGFNLIAEAAARAGVVLIAKDTAGDYSGDSYWTREQIRDRIYHQVDVLAVGSEMEGTPNPALEAMACGVPVVTTPVGDVIQAIAEAGAPIGWVVDRCVESFEIMFESLSRLQCGEAGNRARRFVEKNRTWAQAADGFRRMFKRAAEGNAP